MARLGSPLGALLLPPLAALLLVPLPGPAGAMQENTPWGKTVKLRKARTVVSAASALSGGRFDVPAYANPDGQTELVEGVNKKLVTVAPAGRMYKNGFEFETHFVVGQCPPGAPASGPCAYVEHGKVDACGGPGVTMGKVVDAQGKAVARFDIDHKLNKKESIPILEVVTAAEPFGETSRKDATQKVVAHLLAAGGGPNPQDVDLAAVALPDGMSYVPAGTRCHHRIRFEEARKLYPGGGGVAGAGAGAGVSLADPFEQLYPQFTFGLPLAAVYEVFKHYEAPSPADQYMAKRHLDDSFEIAAVAFMAVRGEIKPDDPPDPEDMHLFGALLYLSNTLAPFFRPSTIKGTTIYDLTKNHLTPLYPKTEPFMAFHLLKKRAGGPIEVDEDAAERAAEAIVTLLENVRKDGRRLSGSNVKMLWDPTKAHEKFKTLAERREYIKDSLADIMMGKKKAMFDMLGVNPYSKMMGGLDAEGNVCVLFENRWPKLTANAGGGGDDDPSGSMRTSTITKLKVSQMGEAMMDWPSDATPPAVAVGHLNIVRKYQLWLRRNINPASTTARATWDQTLHEIKGIKSKLSSPTIGFQLDAATKAKIAQLFVDAEVTHI